MLLPLLGVLLPPGVAEQALTAAIAGRGSVALHGRSFRHWKAAADHSDHHVGKGKGSRGSGRWCA